MADFEKLMQESETFRMLKIGNPELSKDFGVPELQSGLFELEHQTRKNLENLIYTSPDPNGSIIKHDTALMLNNLGLDMETSRKLAEGGFASTATGIDTRSKSYTEALITKAQHSLWNDMRGVNASLYQFTGNPEFLKNAQEYDTKVFQNPVFESYGEFGDLVLDSVQPAMSSAKFLLTNAILSWIPGGVANKIWGPAVAKVVAKGGGIAATGVNFLSTGYSQAGNVLYDVMQMTDGEGNTLPWDSPVGGILFHALAGLMGLVELGSMEMFPWYKQLKSRFTNREVAEYLKKGLAKSFLDATFKGIVGTGGEQVEEGVQSGLEDGFTNALKAMANKDGADFELISLGDSVKKGTQAFWDAGRSMFLTSFLSAGVGQGVYASKVRIEAAKNFKKSDNSQSIDASFVGVSRTAVADAKVEEAKKGEEVKGKATDTEETKLDPIKVVNVGPRLSPVNDEELRKAAKAVNLGAQAMEVEVVDMPEMQAEDKFSLINRAALASGAKIIDGEELGFEDEQSMIKGMYLIAPSVEAIDDSSVGKIVTIRNENGELSKISMRVIPEDMSEEQVTDPDIMFAEDPKAPYALSMMSEERALEWEERNLIRKALGDVTTHTKGRFSSADVEASIDAVKTVAETLNTPTDKLPVVFHLTDKVQDEWGRDALGSISSNITVDGQKQYTINLSRKANVSTVLHELGHLLRGMATKEQLVEFRKYYGEGEEAAFLEDINFTGGKYHVGNQIFDTIEDARDYVIGNEERFADDFIAYMMTGEAPTAGLKNIFRRMKAVLHRFIAQYGNRLTPEVKEAFDNLLSGRESESVSAELSPQEMGEETFYQVAPPDYQPKSTGIGYKVFVQKDGKLYPPMVANPNGEGTPVGKWLLADEAPIAAYSKTGRPQVKSGGKGTQGGSGLLAYRPGWHLGEIPYAKQFNRLNPATGIKELFPKDFVWAEVEYSKDNDYNDEARQNGVSKNGGFNHALASLHRMPTDGFYNYRTNPDPTTDPWVITGAMKVNKILTREEVETIVKDAGREPQKVEGDNILFQKALSRAEYAEVYDRYYNTDQWMKAPNGEWSNLTEQQWVQVRTPAFIEWFGDWMNDPENTSKVLDENGEPLAVYHGTTQSFNTFRYGDLGFHFGSEDQAETRVEDEQNPIIMKAYLSIKNPYQAEYDYGSWDGDYVARMFLEREEFTDDADVSVLKDIAKHQTPRANLELRKFLRDKGYDGVVYPNSFEGESEKDSYIAFSPTQIKSATDNIGTFDAGNPNILFQKAPEEGTPEFEEKLGRTKVVGPDGKPVLVHHGTNVDFEDFRKEFEHSGVGKHQIRHGIYFTSSMDVAQDYAIYHDSPEYEEFMSVMRPQWDALNKKYSMDQWDSPEYNREYRNLRAKERRLEKKAPRGNLIISAYLNMENPLEMSATDPDWKGLNDAYFKAVDRGHDGLIVHDISDTPFGGNKPSTIYIVGENEQVFMKEKTKVYAPGGDLLLFQYAPEKGSEAFKQWFGDSKVVDENGNPLVVYHGTTKNFNTFDSKKSASTDRAVTRLFGFFFTEDKDDAERYATWNLANGTILEAYLSIQKPYHISFAEFDAIAMHDFNKMKEAGFEYTKEDAEKWEKESIELVRETRQSLIDQGYDGIFVEDRFGNEGSVFEYIAFYPTQVKSVNNQGTWDAGDPNILYQKTMDSRYFEALDRGDEETARKIVDDMARKRGYLSGNDFRMNHTAPNGRNDYDVNLPNLDGSELLPKDFWDHPGWYAGDHELYSFWKVKRAIDRYRRNGKANIRLYRAVPKDVREDWFRNGDWVTPDREYARTEGLSIPGGYRIIAHSVPIEHVWWDVNSIAELGYDDGGEYVYRNTKNNRKLFDTVVRDADGNIVPPSKRFNFRSDTLYQKAPKEGTKEFEQTFALTKIVDENGNPRMVYHGSMREWQGVDTEFDPHEIGSQSDSGDAGEGFYFATTPLGAYMYTNGKQDNVHGYYLDIRNPFVIGEQYDRETTQAWEAIRQDEDPGVLPTVQMIADMVREAGYDPGELTKFRGYVSAYDVVQRVGSGNFSNLLKAKGYDGVVYGDEIVAFDPGQIYYASKPAALYQIEAYHGTSKDFDKFSTDFIGSGFSGGAYGWGLYFTTNENIARDYAEIVGIKNLEKRALYRINLGRIGKHTLLPWSEPINERVRSMLREPMLKLEYPQSLHRDYGTSTTEELVSKVFGGNVTGNSLYFFLDKAFDDWSGEKASLFLREHGITGTVKSDLMGNYTYAIFDEDAVEIVGKTLYKMAPPLETEDFKKWYGSSVLVDGKGNPIELLHGSPSIFNDFTRTQKNDNGYLGAGHYFTEHRGVAQTYATKNNDGYIYHAYLKMENPLRYDQEWDKKWTEIRNEVVAENPEVPEYSNLFGKLLAEKLQDNGYDGVLDMRNGTVAEAVVFSNDQIGIVAVENYNLGEAGSEYNRRKIGEMRQRQIAKKAVQQAIPDLSLAQENLIPPTLYQVQNLPKWKEDTRAWMKANGYTRAQIDRHIAGIEGQLKIFDYVGPYEIDLLPHGAGLNPWKQVTQKGNVTYQGGPIRTNDDSIYRISFDLSAMCPKRLSAAATANYVQKKIGRPLSDSERMALTALYRAHGKEAPCIYCYVESPRSKASSFVLNALEVVLGGDAPKTWGSETLSLAEEARAEAVAKNVQRGDLNAHILMDPELASSDEFKAEVDKYPAIYKFLKKQMLNAKANLPKLYEEYEGQILNLPDDFIDMLNGYAGIRFFSSSDFQAQHVVDLIQAVYDMNVRGAKAHAYTKVPMFVEVFGGTGIKINTSIFAKEENGQIVEDNWQGMGWEDAKRFRQQYDNVGSILVASSDNIVKWALEQDWIDYIIPFHFSSLEKKYYNTMNWQDFTSTQVEKPINAGEEVQKIRQFETGSVDGISNAEGTKRYLELAMQRGIIPVFPTFLFNDGMEDVVGKHGKPYKNQRKARTDRAIARWREMVESGEIDWSQINPNYYKLRKDYARTDTPFNVVEPNINLEQASDILKEYLSGAEDGVRGEREIGDELVRMIIDSEGTDINLGIEVLRGVQEGRMSGKETLFQRISPPESQEFMSWYKGSVLVDVDGAPLKLYHGTTSIFTEYNSEYGTLNMGDSEGSEGFFFTTDKDEAISYAEFAVSPEVMAYKDEHRAVLRKMGELGVKRGSDHPLEERALELERKITEEEDLIGIGAQAWDPVVSGVYVRITNPAIIDLSDPDITGEIDFQQLVQEAKANGHDGFIYKNVNDSDAMHVVAFSDSQVGAVEYSLSSEGYEMDHEFPAGDTISESAIDYRGHKIIPHDLGMDYSEENLDAIIKEVDDELRQITLYQPQEERKPYPIDVNTGKRLTKKQKGHKDEAYTNIWGWDGSEDHPTIDGDWTKFRKLDLEGAILRDVSDIAKLFSIYRNPYVEFFHVIYTREMADGTIKVKGHHAMTSGAPGFAIALSRRFPNDITEGMKKYRATGYYIMHNHPSGRVNPSWQDHDITVRYARSVPGFKGHIILNHNKFYLYDIPYKELREQIVEVPEGGFHKTPSRPLVIDMEFNSPEDLAEYGIRVMESREMLVMYLDNLNRVGHAQPVETLNIDEIYENVEKYLYSKVALVTSSKKRYQEALEASRVASVSKGEIFLDIMLHHTKKKDGSVTITSALMTGHLSKSGNDFWRTKYARKRGALPENDSYVFERGETLYQLSDEARKRVVESRKEDVRKAIENYYWIPDDVLQEYIGEDWADREIRFRTRLKENPWVLEEARGYTDPDEYIEFVTSRDMQDGKESSAEAKKWWRRVYEYARVESAAERNLRFVREHTSTDKDLIALGNRLRSYIETDQETGNRYFRWGTFKGVSPLVKALTANSPSEDIQKARALVADNPEPYRKALLKITQAERVVDNEGKFYLPTREEREAYYDSLGEEMRDALNEPLLINQMADEGSEILGTSATQRDKYSTRERMATHNGVLEIENQADKELAALRSEYDRKTNSLTELQKRFEIVTKEVNKLGDELRGVRKDRSNLKRKLKGTQETAVNLREALAEKREAYRKLERERKALERKLHAVRTRRDLERYHKAILASAKFNPDSVDASYEETLNIIHDLFRQDHKEGDYKILPEMLTRYLDDEGLHAIKTNKRIGDWSLGELMTLYYAIRAMKTDARVMLEQKRVERSGRLQNLAIKYYDQLYGQLPEIDPMVGGVMGSIIEELSIKQKKYQEGMPGAIWNTVAGAVIHSQRLARIIDGNREGVMYDLLVRRAYENSSKELSRSFERLEAAEAKMQELGVTDKSLREDLYTYTTVAGDEITLTRGEVLGLYVYGQNEIGMEKLIMPWGNGIQPGQLAAAVGKLTDAEKAWGDYMIDELGGDDPWERMRDVFYNVYNKNLGRRKRYFTFVVDGNLNEGNTDILNGPKGRPIRYTDKGMTKEVVPHARYALKLDVTRTFTQQVKRQEHFIAWAEWVRDMNYLLSSRGSIGAMIEANHGSKILTQVQDFVNDIGSPQVILDDIERLGNKILSNAVVGALSFNALTPLKQLASLSAVVRGDIDISSLFHAARRLGNPAIHGEIVKMIHEKSPKMKNRTFDIEVAKYIATEFDTELGMAIKAINEKVGMKAIEWMDQLVANIVWLSAYDTALKRGATDAEAAFRATEVVGETQSSTNISDLSSLQRNKSPWVRSMIMFTNDIIQHLNQIWFDLPYYVRTKQYRKAFGTMANVALSGAIVMLVSGQLFRGDDDDEEYLKKIAKAILETIVSDTIPIVGNAVASGVSGWGGGDMVDLPSAFGRFLGATTELEGEKLLGAFLNLIEAGLKFGALPVTAGNRAVRAVREQNPLHLLGYDYAELWESWL